MVRIESGNVIFSSDEQHQKALFPMIVMDCGKWMLLSDAHPWNVPFSIDVIVLGNVICVNDLQN